MVTNVIDVLQEIHEVDGEEVAVVVRFPLSYFQWDIEAYAHSLGRGGFGDRGGGRGGGLHTIEHLHNYFN